MLKFLFTARARCVNHCFRMIDGGGVTVAAALLIRTTQRIMQVITTFCFAIVVAYVTWFISVVWVVVVGAGIMDTDVVVRRQIVIAGIVILVCKIVCCINFYFVKVIYLLK